MDTNNEHNSSNKETNHDSMELCLLGTGGLANFIEYVQNHTEGGKDIDELDLVDIWRAGAKYYAELEKTDSGAADNPEILPLPIEVQPYLDELVTLPHISKSFNNVPVHFGMVELDKLVVSQCQISIKTVGKLHAKLKNNPSIQMLLEICMPKYPANSSYEIVSDTDGNYIFKSDTHDFRFLEAQLLSAEQVPNFKTSGHPKVVLALAVGDSANIFNVVRYGNRLVLNNGYHRAYAMRLAGITHAPCIIQVCEHKEEIGLAAASDIAQNSDYYFKVASRPPILKDYFDPKLTVQYKSIKEFCQVHLTYKTNRLFVK